PRPRVLPSPQTRTCPLSGCSRPAITRSNVDLPLPLGPSRAVSPPSGTSIETSSSATKSPNRLVTLLTVMAISGLLFNGLRDENGRRGRSSLLVIVFIRPPPGPPPQEDCGAADSPR